MLLGGDGARGCGAGSLEVCWEVGGASAGGTELLRFWGVILYQKVGVQCSTRGGNVVPGGLSVLEGCPVPAQGGGQCGAGPGAKVGVWWAGSLVQCWGPVVGGQDSVFADKSPSPRGGDSVGQCPPAALLWAWDNQDDSPFPAPDSSVPCWELGGARRGRASCPSLGLCCLLLLSKG